ncbi:MAG: hypothetical protein Q8R90_00755 [Bacteroidales bacterium]|nr:hypothetical protein [Bacteroidales bacterium]MDP3451457.1 hypothetical protein [Bacteroidales bacterium]
MTEQFKTWALVELFGHSRIAGEVSEQTIAGGAMVRIDVPETETSPAFTRIVNVSAIYAINPMTEEMAMILAGQLNVKPIQAWDIREYFEKNKKALMPVKGDDESFEAF